MTSRLLSGPVRLTVAIALTIERLDRGDAEYWMRLYSAHALGSPSPQRTNGTPARSAPY